MAADRGCRAPHAKAGQCQRHGPRRRVAIRRHETRPDGRGGRGINHLGPHMGAAIGWGALAASSLVVGAALALVRDWPEWVVGLVLAFGAGALISAVSYELAQES